MNLNLLANQIMGKLLLYAVSTCLLQATLFSQNWGVPVLNGQWKVTQTYNTNFTHICYGRFFSPSSANGNPACDSYAIDFVPIGTDKTVIAVESGIITMKKWQGDYGNTILVEHSNGIYSRYAHLESFNQNLPEVGVRNRII